MKKDSFRRKLFVSIGAIFVAVVIFAGGLSKKISDTKAEKKAAERIVCLSPASTEICFAIGVGDKVVAVTSYCDYPEEAKKLPVVGGFDGNTISVEAIISYEPDLVYLTDGMHNFLIPKLESLGIDYILSTANSISGIEDEILLAGEKTNHQKEAEKVAAEIKTAAASVSVPGNPVSIYWEVWNAPYMSAGPLSFINDLISTCGGKNIFEDCENEAYPIVSEESIIARQPEIILIPASSGVTAELVAKRAGWENIPAVKNGKIFVVDDNIYTRPGPRICDVIKELSTIVQSK